MTGLTAEQPETALLRGAAAEDLRLLAHLHGSELSAEALADLQRGPFAELLALQLSSTLAAEALQVIDEGLRAEVLAAMAVGDEDRVAGNAGEPAATNNVGETAPMAAAATDDNPAAVPSRDPLDYLAADFAAIYLTHHFELSPCESPWLDEDGLMNGPQMFAVRGWYERFGLAAENWRLRGDDHIALQLSFIAHLLDREGDGLLEAGRFMDEHLRRWLPDFANGVARRCATPFYAGLGMLTYAYIEELRDVIEQLTGEPRREFENEQPETEEDDSAPFAGGAGPGLVRQRSRISASILRRIFTCLQGAQRGA